MSNMTTISVNANKIIHFLYYFMKNIYYCKKISVFGCDGTAPTF